MAGKTIAQRLPDDVALMVAKGLGGPEDSTPQEARDFAETYGGTEHPSPESYRKIGDGYHVMAFELGVYVERERRRLAELERLAKECRNLGDTFEQRYAEELGKPAGVARDA